MSRADDDAERSDAEERRDPAGDDAERSDAEERRATPAGDDDAGAVGIQEWRT
jgi:hypothetical protein